MNQSNSNDVDCCVYIQGLPLLATPMDIRHFFSECQIAMRGINIAHDGRGKPLGEGFVEFVSKVDFEKAIKKDKTSLGRHIVAVKPIAKKDMMSRLDNARQQGGGGAPGGGPPGNGPPGGGPPRPGQGGPGDPRPHGCVETHGPWHPDAGRLGAP